MSSDVDDPARGQYMFRNIIVAPKHRTNSLMLVYLIDLWPKLRLGDNRVLNHVFFNTSGFAGLFFQAKKTNKEDQLKAIANFA